MIKVLEILTALDQGGVDKIIFDYCTRLSSEFKIDFIISQDNCDGILEQKLIKRGYNVFHMPKIKDNIIKHCLYIKNIIQENKYDIIHDNSGYKSFPNLFMAFLCHVPVRIAHTHIAEIPENLLEKTIRITCAYLTKFFATNLCACGELAGKWTWGNEDFENGRVKIIKNAIETDIFKFNNDIRRRLRKSLELENRVVIGSVARFAYQKNHEYMIDVFFELQKIRPDVVLLLIGDGIEKEQIKKKVKSLNLNENVVFLGIRSDVNELLNVLDVFILTSRFEGLPIVLVEAQANGLPVVCSTAITKEIGILSSTHFLSLNIEPQKWAEVINSMICQNVNRMVTIGDYDINVSARLFESYLKSLVE